MPSQIEARAKVTNGTKMIYISYEPAVTTIQRQFLDPSAVSESRDPVSKKWAWFRIH